MTSGCTRESQDFRDLAPAFRKAGAQIVGVSRDSVASHDEVHGEGEAALSVAERHGRSSSASSSMSSKRRVFTVRKYLGIERSTFLLDGKGVLRHEWRKVKVPGHAEEVLEAAKSL